MALMAKSDATLMIAPLSSFCSKVVVGWISTWLGSPVSGYWPHRFLWLQHGDIWFIPAILGAAAVLVVAIDIATMARSAR